MNVTMAVPARDIPRPPADQALGIARADLDATLALLRDLDAADWRRPTSCTGWTVHDVVAHLAGQCEEWARPDRMIRRVRRARRSGSAGLLDRHNQLQVHDRADTGDQQLIADLEHWAGKGLRAIGRIPAPLRHRMRLSLVFPEETKLLPEDSFDYLIRVLLARDCWMHRLDIAAATGRTTIPGQHDTHVVEQVVHDLSLAWNGPAVALELAGPAGGRWTLGPGDPAATVRADAIAFMRRLSGRPAGETASIDGDAAAGAALLAMRIEF
jgi:uncharacterized protein (TIGR03083 family)